MRKLLAIILTLLTASCKKEHEPCVAKDLTPNAQEKAFFKTYDTLKVNDILRFSNAGGSIIDTFVVNKATKGYIDDNMGGSGCDNYYHAYHDQITILGKSSKEVTYIDYALNQYRTSVVTIQDYAGYNYIRSNQKVSDTTLLGHTFTNVYGFDNENPPFYTPQDGLIFYYKGGNKNDPRVLLR